MGDHFYENDSNDNISNRYDDLTQRVRQVMESSS